MRCPKLAHGVRNWEPFRKEQPENHYSHWTSPRLAHMGPRDEAAASLLWNSHCAVPTEKMLGGSPSRSRFAATSDLAMGEPDRA